MPLYLIERRFAEQIDVADVPVKLIEEINLEEGVSWLTSFLTADRQQSYCLYEAPSPDAIVKAAQRAGLPADVVVEVERLRLRSLRAKQRDAGEVARMSHPQLDARSTGIRPACSTLAEIADFYERRSDMRLKVALVLAGVAVVPGAGIAIAAHATEIDPATVPTGFFVAHNYVDDIPVSTLARAVQPNGADVFVQHLTLNANQVSAWHTHPGPVIVTVRSGSDLPRPRKATRAAIGSTRQVRDSSIPASATSTA